MSRDARLRLIDWCDDSSNPLSTRYLTPMCRRLNKNTQLTNPSTAAPPNPLNRAQLSVLEDVFLQSKAVELTRTLDINQLTANADFLRSFGRNPHSQRLVSLGAEVDALLRRAVREHPQLKQKNRPPPSPPQTPPPSPASSVGTLFATPEIAARELEFSTPSPFQMPRPWTPFVNISDA